MENENNVKHKAKNIKATSAGVRMHCAHRGSKATSTVSGHTMHTEELETHVQCEDAPCTQENETIIWICGNKISEVVAKLE